jgi:hypothetical protein
VNPQLNRLIAASLLLVAVALAAEETPVSESVAKGDATASETAAQGDGAKSKEAKAETGDKTLLGISILGNQEAPKALVIVPWKSSQLGDSLGLSNSLDDARQPVDKDVFMRELAYYEIRSN